MRGFGTILFILGGIALAFQVISALLPIQYTWYGEMQGPTVGGIGAAAILMIAGLLMRGQRLDV